VSLFAYLKNSPDSIEQATSFFSIGYVGSELKADSVPFSLLKMLIDKSYEAARRVLSPVFLAGARSSTYDFPARTIPGSLILALDEPFINPRRLFQRTSESPVSIEDARAYFAQQRESFFDEVGELVGEASRGQIADSLAEERFSLLDNLQHIIPSDENRIDRVEFAGGDEMSVRALVVDELTGTRMHRAFKRVERQAVTESGRIEIVNIPSKSFVYRSTRGKQVTCYIPAQAFERLHARGLMRTGALVRVRGHLSKRSQRDEMRTDYEPDITMQPASRLV
jgi:hypothetical protein